MIMNFSDHLRDLTEILSYRFKFNYQDYKKGLTWEQVERAIAAAVEGNLQYNQETGQVIFQGSVVDVGTKPLEEEPNYTEDPDDFHHMEHALTTFVLRYAGTLNNN